jgi:hypothetical protein
MKCLKCTKLLFCPRNLNEDSQAAKALKSLKQSAKPTFDECENERKVFFYAEE